jgi:hypothetical protein
VRRVLYRLPSVIAASLVIVVEGEKNANDLNRALSDYIKTHRGFPFGSLTLDHIAVTTNAGGARAWKPEHGYGRFFAGKVVIKLGDNDEPGRQHDRDVGEDTLVGTALQAAPAALGAADAAFPGRPVIPNPPSPSAIKAKLYPTSQSLAPATSAARNLSKALVVDPAGVNNFVRAATDEAGTVVDFAQKNNLPINSKVDFANAAKQTADAVQSHFDDNILGPNAKKIVAVPASFQGPTMGEGNNATLGAINDRINAINSELKSNYRKPLQSQTSAANTSDAELLSEKTALTNVLHKQLGDATGLPPEDIADLRVQAGKLRTIADESQASANRDLTAAGKQAMGTTTSAVGTKAGIVDRGLQFVQGGPEIIGNRQINLALKKIQPQPLNLPQPNPVGVPPPAPRVPTGGPSTVIPGPDYTPDPNAGNILRDRIAARQPAPVEAPPQPIKQMQKWADAGAAKMTTQGLTASDVNRLGALPAGKQLLIQASGLPPGSAVMKNLVSQAQRLLATGEANYR